MTEFEVGFWIVYLTLAALALLDLWTAPTIERKDW